MAIKQIKFSEHSRLKIDILKKHGITVFEKLVEEIIRQPLKIETGYKSRKVAQGNLDLEHVLRVIYEENPDEILVITLYPGRKDRYEKD